jgi:hypothetical protein
VGRFEGWYYKHQKDGRTVCFIPGRADGGAFVQVLSNDRSWHFDMPDLQIRDGVLLTGGCSFSKTGCVVDLPGIAGRLDYGPALTLRSDIMGPFRYLPTQCRHGVISMRHTIKGVLRVEGQAMDFSDGLGYIETDSGRSFPSEYLWVQCSDFPGDCCLMLSLARIPLAGLCFTGCICAIVYEGREFRLATYRGVRILAAGPEHIRLAQGNLFAEIDIHGREQGQALKSPQEGAMSGVIRESNRAHIALRLWERGKMLFELESRNAGFEYVPGNPV